MNRLYSYQKFTESRKLSIHDLEIGDEVSYTRKNGKTAFKTIIGINHDKELVYFNDKGMNTFSKNIEQINSKK